MINFIISNIWYGPLFGNRWYQLHGVVADKVSGTVTKDGVSQTFNAGLVITSAIIGAILTAFILSYLFGRMSVKDWKEGLLTGVLIGALLLITLHVNNLFSSNSHELSLIEGGAAVLLFGLYGALLGGWRKK